MASVEEITEVLSDMTFPTTRERIIEHARKAGATVDVIGTLRTLPDEEYVDYMDVWDNLGAIREEGPEAADSEDEDPRLGA